MQRAWMQMRFECDKRAKQLVARAFARGHHRGRYLTLGFEHWATRWRGKRMRRQIEATLHPERTAMSFALGMIALSARKRVRARGQMDVALRRIIHARLYERFRLWKVTHSSNHIRRTSIMHGVMHRLASGTRRAFLALAIEAVRCLSFSQATLSLFRRRRKSGFKLWRSQCAAFRALASMGGGARQHGRLSARRRAFTAMRIHSQVAHAGKSLARMSLSGREQLAGMETQQAWSVLRRNAERRRLAKSRVLVASEAGVRKRAAALLQPLRALAAVLLTRCLSRWRSVAVFVEMEKRVSGLQAVLEAEAVLKRRQFESHQAQLEHERREQKKQQFVLEQEERGQEGQEKLFPY